ncbi:TetR/AcrR family transcriptional regulator [Actinomadura craniellae]|uniref:TetR/AcrR family transcriptional regulator n=1 Tax=Actinomadura craniellae TaxID=2231787 RepID=A0A365GZS0_9ACTN|nr:TetR family transcriptional regulator [Actinomadura craniellae]RAY12322.1 TetR/AcrR family transcriptional regulator [Actinomadura craniellae]
MTSGQQVDFQRARTTAQRAARRRAILAAAAELLGEMPVSDISLRELSRRVGLSKTNVVRYFETREAVFFALLNQALDEWLDELPDELPPAGRASPASVMDAWARSAARRPLLCELWSSLGTELERNISTEAVRGFKLAHHELQIRLAELVRERVPALTEPAARELVALSIVLTAGLWPFANPSPSVAEAVKDPALAHSRIDFADRLGRALTLTVTGLMNVSPHPDGASPAPAGSASRPAE